MTMTELLAITGIIQAGIFFVLVIIGIALMDVRDSVKKLKDRQQ